MTDKKPRPQVAVLPNGMKKNLVTFGIETDDLQSEIQATIQSLLSFVKDDYLMEDGGSHEGDSQIPTLSSTDLQGIDLLVNNEEIDIIISFCKEGEDLEDQSSLVRGQAGPFQEIQQLNELCSVMTFYL